MGITKEEEEALLDIVLTQDIEFYKDYMESFKNKIISGTLADGLKLAAIQLAIEQVWIALNNLREVIND